MGNWANDWEITCTRLRIMMMKRGIESIPITCNTAESKIDRFVSTMSLYRHGWADHKKSATA